MGRADFPDSAHICIIPVSYTHLDVYKRQPYSRATPGTPNVPEAAIVIGFSPTLTGISFDTKNPFITRINICLLYTSRCV